MLKQVPSNNGSLVLALKLSGKTKQWNKKCKYVDFVLENVQSSV